MKTLRNPMKKLYFKLILHLIIILLIISSIMVTANWIDTNKIQCEKDKCELVHKYETEIKQLNENCNQNIEFNTTQYKK